MSSWMLGFVAWVALTPGGVVRGVEPTLWADYLQGILTRTKSGGKPRRFVLTNSISESGIR